ncbi:MAG TPA: hypothetical protein VJM77_00175, partial [Nitrospiria bacterium]|nr:hypothetical protein [Nitrospiria bacterium]
MNRLLVLSVILLLLLFFRPDAQSFLADSSLEGKPITSISVSAKTLTPQDITRMTGLVTGMPF